MKILLHAWTIIINEIRINKYSSHRQKMIVSVYHEHVPEKHHKIYL